jgi:DNA polymerase
MSDAAKPGTGHVDIETRSVVDLEEVGAARYAADPTTEVLCLAYALDDGPIKIWRPGEAVPSEFADAIIWVAHNANFERQIFKHILGPRHGFPIAPIERWRCTMAMALAAALPANLKRLGAALDLKHRKADDAIMRKMCRPRKPKKGEDLNGIHWHDSPELRKELELYCCDDGACEREAYHVLPALSETEQALWVLDQTVNDRGFFTDGALIEAACAAAEMDDEIAEFRRLTGLNPTQVAKIKDWLAGHGCTVSGMDKKTLRHALSRKSISPEARRAVELRLDTAHAAADKPLALALWRMADGRVRGALQYHGAATGRWSGRGPQPQNFRREGKEIDAKIATVLTGYIAKVRTFGAPAEVVGDIARGMICAAPGHRLLVGDFTGIESIVLAWISGEQTKLDQWIKFITSGDKNDHPYWNIGRAFGHPEDVAYDLGKRGDLSFGYQGGVKAYRNFAPADDPATDEQIKGWQQKWQALHPMVKRFWWGVNGSAVAAVRHPGLAPHAGVLGRTLRFCADKSALHIRLPSGRELSYPSPRLTKDGYDRDAVVFKDNAQGKWVDCRGGNGAYGGTWTENIVSGIARDLLAAAMLRLEAAGYRIVLHVHDEIVCEMPDGQGNLDEFRGLIEAVPEWAAGLPVAAKVRNGFRFSKSDAATGPAPPPPASAPSEDDLPWGCSGELPRTRRTAEAGGEPSPEEPPPPPSPRQPKDRKASPRAAKGRVKGNGTYPRGEDEKGDATEEWIYRNVRGALHMKVVKCVDWDGGKQYPVYRPENGRWVKGAPSGSTIPYRLPELMAAPRGTPIWIGEGEKCAEALRGLGLVASTNPYGAEKWSSELNKWFDGFPIAYVCEDNDAPGRRHAHQVAAALRGVVPDVRIVQFRKDPDNEHDGYDIADWVEEDGGTLEELLERAEKAPKFAALQSTCAADEEITTIDWVWPCRFARGKIGLLVGLPDEGKGLFLSYLMATVSRGGAWPCGEGTSPQGNIIMLSAEDDINDTIVPRLEAAGVDRKRVHIIKMVRDPDAERMFNLITDLEALRALAAEIGNVTAIIIDPVSAYLGVAKVDSFRVTDVRAILAPLKEMAEELRTAIVGVMHFNKKIDITNVMLRVSDSLAYVAASRHVYGIVDDAENKRKLFIKGKNNLAPRDQATLAFSFAVKEVGPCKRTGKPVSAPYITWHPEPVDVTALEAMSAAAENKSPGVRDRAKRLLRSLLAEEPAGAKIILETGKEHGISDKTLRRAAQELDVEIKKEGPVVNGERTWIWRLPKKETP